MQSLADAYNTYTEIDRISDLDRLVNLASYVVETWPEKEQADVARMNLSQIYYGMGRYDESIKALGSVRTRSQQWIPIAATACVPSPALDRFIVSAHPVVDLAQVHAGHVGLLLFGPGLDDVGRQVDEPIEIADPVNLGVGVVRIGKRLHGEVTGLGREPALRVAPGEVFGKDVGLVELVVLVITEREQVAAWLAFSRLRAGSALRIAALSKAIAFA